MLHIHKNSHRWVRKMPWFVAKSVSHPSPSTRDSWCRQMNWLGYTLSPLHRGSPDFAVWFRLHNEEHAVWVRGPGLTSLIPFATSAKICIWMVMAQESGWIPINIKTAVILQRLLQKISIDIWNIQLCNTWQMHFSHRGTGLAIHHGSAWNPV